MAIDILVTANPLLLPPATPTGAEGAVIDFLGVVRELEDGSPLQGLEYEAHAEMAHHQMEKLAADAVRQFGLCEVVVHHRTGFVAVGDVSLVVRVMAPHRAAAFEGCRWIIEELKKSVPVWKKPVWRA